MSIIQEGDKVVVVSDAGLAPIGTVGVAEFGHTFFVPCMGMRDGNGRLWSFYEGVGLQKIEENEGVVTI